MLGIVLVLATGVVGVAAADDGTGGDYLVRAVFDSADFIVESEEVRVAGAKVGTIKEVDVSRPDEVVSNEDGAVPGKAILVLEITEDGFQDFREDASCLIRPQSLLGEKFVDCLPTQPRAEGSEPPPLIEPIPEGQPGEGQRLLPLENNGKAVDLDLVNNIMREPEVDRFRIILNELGAGLAARGEDLAEVIQRANPALEQTDRVLAILAAQNKQLARLAKDSDTALAPLARERRAVSGFINSAGETATASAERSEDIGAGIARMPRFFSELELTMRELRGFAEAGTPLARDLRVAAPSLTGVSRELTRFGPPAARALITLGDAAEQAGPDLAASDPVIRQIGKLARKAEPAARVLTTLLRSLRKSGGYDELMKFIFNVAGGFNGFDEFGHYLRAQLLVTNCVDYVVTPITGCTATWTGQTSPTAATARGQRSDLERRRDEAAGAADADAGGGGGGGGASEGPAEEDATPALPPAEGGEGGESAPPGPGVTEPALGDESDDDRRGHRAGRDPRGLPRLQRQRRPPVHLHLPDLGARPEREHARARQRGADRRRAGWAGGGDRADQRRGGERLRQARPEAGHERRTGS
jgi:phospholipid/cholesterol/gamma-HCH transport system substrate-binding protein